MMGGVRTVVIRDSEGRSTTRERTSTVRPCNTGNQEGSVDEVTPDGREVSGSFFVGGDRVST